MSDTIPEPPNTKRPTSKTSPDASQLSKYRITQDIGLVIDNAKREGTWACELEDKDFDFLVNGAKCDDVVWENVHVFRKGKREEVEARHSRTAEDLIEEEQEISRKRREVAEAKKGQLPRQPDQEYHPKDPKAARR